MRKKVFIATPAYSGTVHVPYAISLAETHTYLLQNGIECVFQINCSGSLLVAERNRLIYAFMKSDATHMLCIDGDLGWPCVAVKEMVDADVDFIAGVYPTRKDNLFLFRPTYNPDKSIVKHPTKNLLSMQYIPAGFMLLKREAIQKMIDHFPELFFESKDSISPIPNGYALFNTELMGGEFWGEDYVFCRRAREAGLDIWVDPIIEFDHAGVKGMFAYVLTDKPEHAAK
jgi:hypothetical protein